MIKKFLSDNRNWAVAALCFLTLSAGVAVDAKDMTSRLGVGYSNSFSVAPMPSLAVKYYPSTDLAFSAALGLDTNTTNSNQGLSNLGLGVKVYKTIFTEDFLNFFMGAGAAILNTGPASNNSNTNLSSSSGYEFDGFIGAEFFIKGLESIGFNFRAGAGVSSLSSGIRFRTIGESPLQAGMYFYF